MNPMILPPATLGMLGGGQLGRFFVSAAHELGYQVWVLDPDKNSPAGQIAERHFCVDYADYAALDEFAAGCAAITTEFENVPAASLDYLAKFVPVRPGAAAVAVCQHRVSEKSFLRDHGFPHGPFIAVNSENDLKTAPDALFKTNVSMPPAVEQDAVAAANILAEPLLCGDASEDDLAKVQRRRMLPTRVIQRLQTMIQSRVIGTVLTAQMQAIRVPWPVRLSLANMPP